MKEIDWKGLFEKYYPLINEETTNQELFEISCSMLQELNDGHVTLEPNFIEEEIDCGPPYKFQLEEEFSTIKEWSQFMGIIDKTLSENGLLYPIKIDLPDETNFQYRISDSLGYLRLDEMTERITFGKFKRAIDQAIDNFQGKKGLIIDLRFNGGGWDHNAYKLASRFIPEGIEVGHYERRKIKGRDEFSPMKYKEICANGRKQFTKPIVILTSDFTASAAEVFVLLMNELNNVTIIGDRTEGIFSDMYEFKLPNGWNVSLSDEQYFSANHVNYEGNGIKPDIEVKNRNSDIERGVDSVLERAFEYIEN